MTPVKKVKLPQPTGVATQNACKLCAPLGAAVVFRGIQGAMPLLHGSQGCSTYIRRYLISHFKEPIDIASSNFSEASAVFGGGKDLHTALRNITKSYQPELIGIASTCLSETMGDDVGMYLKQYSPPTPTEAAESPALVHVSTPSYAGTHMDGFHATVRAVTETLATTDHPHGSHINLLPGFVSPADLRYLKEICATWSPHPPVVAPGGSPGLEGSSGAPAPAGAGPIPAVLLPDYSDTLDGGQWDTYQEIPIGGTPVSALKTMGQAKATIEFGLTIAPRHSAADFLEQKHGIPAYHLGLPIGVRQTDLFLAALEKITGTPPPAWLAGERGRLLDAYVDGHKHCFGQRAIVYGEEDLVVGIAAFLAEVGILPVLLGSGGESGRFAEAAHAAVPNLAADTVIKEGVDFVQLSQLSADLHPDLVIGSSKGYPLARDLRIPLVRTGFPIHDRLGGQRVLHLGYRGAMSLLDRITDAILMRKQETSDVGYAYL